MSYTDALAQVMVTLGRIDGKLDSFDNRLRAVENQQAAWQELLKVQEPDSERWKKRIESQDARLQELENQRSLADAMKHYWYVVALFVVPTLVNVALVVKQLLETGRP